jgi:hypothetical protein
VIGLPREGSRIGDERTPHFQCSTTWVQVLAVVLSLGP